MLFSSFAALLAASSALAAPVPGWKREVPQEHSHEAILRALRPVLALNNPDNIRDVVFGLLGAQAAATGAGNIADPDCLQQATADQAFTNAKAAGDVAGMTVALQYRALERNTGAVGQASVACTSITAKNPEIAAVKQHQDPASQGAAATNKAIVLELAKQIASIGGNPLDALKTGTFAPGTIGDRTGKGNSCNDENDAVGCIISQNKLVNDATEAEITAAVAGVNAPAANPSAADPPAANPPAVDPPADCPTAVTVTVNAPAAQTPVAAPTTSVAAPAATSAAVVPVPAAGNLQKFTGTLGGIAAPTVTAGGRGFVVENNADFLNLSAALGRSCDVQKNQCANQANSGGGFSVGACDQQAGQCRALIDAANSVAAPAVTSAAAAPAPAAGNLQKFTGILGGIAAPTVTAGGRGFVVENNADFLNLSAALGRSCDVQKNLCANQANSGGGFSVGACDQQAGQCRALIQ